MYAVTDANGRPISLFMTAGLVGDDIAAALLDTLPRALWLLGDWGHDAEGVREALQAKGITRHIAVASPEPMPSSTTGDAPDALAGGRSSSNGSATGVAWQHRATDALPSSPSVVAFVATVPFWP